MRDQMCSFYEQMSKWVEKAKTAVPKERSSAYMIDKLFIGKCLAPFVGCVKKRMGMGGLRVLHEDVHKSLLKSRIISVEFCSSLDDYNRALNFCRGWRTAANVLRWQSVYVGQESGAQKQLSSSAVTIRGESDGKKEVWPRSVLLLALCSARKESKRGEPAFVGYMKSVPPLHEVEKAVGCACLQ